MVCCTEGFECTRAVVRRLGNLSHDRREGSFFLDQVLAQRLKSHANRKTQIQHTNERHSSSNGSETGKGGGD